MTTHKHVARNGTCTTYCSSPIVTLPHAPHTATKIYNFAKNMRNISIERSKYLLSRLLKRKWTASLNYVACHAICVLPKLVPHKPLISATGKDFILETDSKLFPIRLQYPHQSCAITFVAQVVLKQTSRRGTAWHLEASSSAEPTCLYLPCAVLALPKIQNHHVGLPHH